MVVPALAALALLAAGHPAVAASPVAPPQTDLAVVRDIRDPPPVSPRAAVRIAGRTPQVRAERRRHPGLRPDSVTLDRKTGTWAVSYYDGDKQYADIIVDGRTGK